MLQPETVERWKKRLEAMRADRSYMEEHLRRDAVRQRVLPEMRSLYDDFVTGKIELEAFRSVYQTKTRVDWDVFGLKGLSGAMFLNTLLKHLPGRKNEIAAQLRAALAFPRSYAEAHPRMQGLYNKLIEFIDTGVTTRKAVQPTRVPFFVSSAWHTQDVETWPAYYESMRRQFAEDGVWMDTGIPVESYFSFVELCRELKSALGINMWELEHLCAWEPAATNAEPPPPSPITPEPPRRRVWLIAPGPRADHWDEFHREGIVGIGWDDLGDLKKYASFEELKDALRRTRGKGEAEPHQDALACWEFTHAMQPGDLVFAKRGRFSIVGYGIVESDYRYDTRRADYNSIRNVKWLWSGDKQPRERPLVTKTLTDVTDYAGLVTELEAAVGVQRVEEAFEPLHSAPIASEVQRAYTVDDAQAELFRPRDELEHLIDLVRHRKNVVLQGPPGVGKTFVASRLANLVMGRNDPENVCFVQFHPSYSYEDFIQGYRPMKAGGFSLRDGPFLRFCDRALQDRDDTYVLIIDEINRGNLGKIFGELMMLIEPDKRDKRWAVTLTYSEEKTAPFYVPPNLYIIGTMNTADRSLAMVDYALRRRFAFVDLEPAINEALFQQHLAAGGVPTTLIERICKRVTKVNELIEKDEGLGKGYLIGHSYFCGEAGGGARDDDWYNRIVEYELEPLLREYWFDRPERANQAAALLLD
jgi:MoxR-like ATPase